jgi:hypothetical protein
VHRIDPARRALRIPRRCAAFARRKENSRKCTKL